MWYSEPNDPHAEASGLHPTIARALWPLTQALPPTPAAPQRSSWSASEAIVAMVGDMPLPDEAQLQSIVAALAKRLDAADSQRFAAVVDCLGLVNMALEDAKPVDEAVKREWHELQADMAADLRRRSA